MTSLLFLCGSPRAYGNTMTLAENLVTRATVAGCACTVAAPLTNLGFEETTPQFTSLKEIEGCRDCGGCKKTGECVIDDRMRSIYQAIERVDGIVWITPTYFGSVPAQLKAVIDRFQIYYSRRKLGRIKVGANRKPVLSIVLGSGKDPYGIEHTFIPLESGSHLIEGDVFDRLGIVGVDRAGEIGEPAFSDEVQSAYTKLDELIMRAHDFATRRTTHE